MKYLSRQIVFREIPNEVSLSYLISGCSLKCPGCHSSDSWSSKAGHDLSVESFKLDLDKYGEWITCVLFMGGEWQPDLLVERLKMAKQAELKTALYTGQDEVSPYLLELLDYIKTGPYIDRLGGLDSARTNQKLIDLRSGRILNSFFTRNREIHNDSAHSSANRR
jgi:anaerobic ribonucleoside-triphosphate reductase activating protein